MEICVSTGRNGGVLGPNGGDILGFFCLLLLIFVFFSFHCSYLLTFFVLVLPAKGKMALVICRFYLLFFALLSSFIRFMSGNCCCLVLTCFGLSLVSFSLYTLCLRPIAFLLLLSTLLGLFWQWFAFSTCLILFAVLYNQNICANSTYFYSPFAYTVGHLLSL